jgi:hypothetical protein
MMPQGKALVVSSPEGCFWLDVKQDTDASTGTTMVHNTEHFMRKQTDAEKTPWYMEKIEVVSILSDDLTTKDALQEKPLFLCIQNKGPGSLMVGNQKIMPDETFYSTLECMSNRFEIVNTLPDMTIEWRMRWVVVPSFLVPVWEQFPTVDEFMEHMTQLKAQAAIGNEPVATAA